MSKVILITGASSGIGYASLIQLVNDGHTVYGSARKKSDAKKIEEVGGRPVPMEMTAFKSLEKAVEHIYDEEGKIDVLFNNAGFGLFGSVEETSIEEARNQFEVNLFGLARLTQLVLPRMRKRGTGTIINTSSMGGKMYTPLGAWYHASKHALEGWSDCLRLELAQFDINVVIIEPGGIETGWGSIAADNIERITSKGAYKTYGKKVAEGMRARYEKSGSLSSPDVIARVVSKAVFAEKPKTRYLAGKYARLLVYGRRILGDRLFDRVIQPR